MYVEVSIRCFGIPVTAGTHRKADESKVGRKYDLTAMHARYARSLACECREITP